VLKPAGAQFGEFIMERQTLRASARHHIVVTVTAAALALCACQGPDSTFNNQNGGTLIGAGLGGLIGNQFGGGSGKVLATIAGVAVGGLIGNQIGKSLDDADRLKAQRAQEQALNQAHVGQTISWNNPQNATHGATKITREGQDQGGRECREYQTTVTIGGKQEQAYGTACRQPDGSWKMVSNT
jgi:surface antigen